MRGVEVWRDIESISDHFISRNDITQSVNPSINLSLKLFALLCCLVPLKFKETENKQLAKNNKTGFKCFLVKGRADVCIKHLKISL